MSEEQKFPTEVIDLPSKGWFYPPAHPLSSGQIELKYMTAKHEDILTSQNLIKKGIVIDKLLEALIVDPSIKHTDLFVGDRNAVMIAARVLGYGKKYVSNVTCPQCDRTTGIPVDLTELVDKKLIFNPNQRGKNEFSFTLPLSKKELTFKILTYQDELNANKELEAIAKHSENGISPEVTTRMRYSIKSVDGSRELGDIVSFIENMPSQDASAFREHARTVNPDLDLTFDFECPKCAFEDRVGVAIDATFFWPELRV